MRIKFCKQIDTSYKKAIEKNEFNFFTTGSTDVDDDLWPCITPPALITSDILRRNFQQTIFTYFGFNQFLAGLYGFHKCIYRIAWRHIDIHLQMREDCTDYDIWY